MSHRGRTWIDRMPDELAGQRALLRGLLAACESDERIRWLVVACSVGRGAADRLSDLDLGMGIAGDQFDAALPDVRRLVDGLGDLVDSYHHHLPGLTITHERIFAQYSNRCQVDLVVFLATETIGQVLDAVVLYDPDGQVFPSSEPRPVTAEQAREWAFGGWCALIDLSKYLRRGSPWEALQRLHDAQAQLWRLWATCFEVPNPQYGLTSILDFAPERLPPDMKGTVSDLDRASILAAGQNLARQLTEVGGLLRPDLKAAMPTAMGSFVTLDLAEMTPA